MTAVSFNSSVTLCAGTRPWASAAAAISALARTISLCSNWPGLRMAAGPGAPGGAETEAISPEAGGGHLFRAGRLGQGNVGEQIAGAAHQDVQVLLPQRMARVVNAHAGHFPLVGGAVEHAHDHFGMFFFASRLRPVLAVAGEIEHRTDAVLQIKRPP